jgi:DNA gyrase subunit A
VPEKQRSAKGVYVANVPGLALEADEQVARVLPLAAFDPDRFLVFATAQGTVKRTSLDAFDSPRSVLIALRLNDGDELIGVTITSGDDDLMLVSRRGNAIRFHESDVRPMGRTAAGVRGMRLDEEDALLAMAHAHDEDFLLVVTDRGYGKRTPVSAYPTQKRGGRGVLTARIVEARGHLAGGLVVPYEAEILLVTDAGTVIRMDLADVRPMGRATQGVSLMRADDDARVVGVATVVDEPDE